MITVQEAFSWLNIEEGSSHLGKSSQFSVWQIHDSKVIEEERNAIIDALVHCMHDFTDPLEKAEVFVNLGVDRYHRKYPDQSRRYLLDAVRIYNEQKDRHRQAVAEWILFIVRNTLLENIQAHSHARASRHMFYEQANHYKPFGDPAAVKVRWYHAKITDMTRDLDAVPEEAFEWIAQFEPSKLNNSIVQVRDGVRESITAKCFTEAYQKIGTLRNVTQHCPDSLETAEAQAFCGLSMYQMGNAQGAVRYLRSALACSKHSGHRHASIRWMLGLILFSIPEERCSAITQLEACLSSFELLCQQADRRNRLKEVEWYQTQLEAMKTVINQMVVEKV